MTYQGITDIRNQTMYHRQLSLFRRRKLLLPGSQLLQQLELILQEDASLFTNCIFQEETIKYEANKPTR